MSLSQPAAASSAVVFDPGSYRDRQARVVLVNGNVCRALSPTALREWEAVSASRFFGKAVAEGRIVATHRVTNPRTVEPIVQAGWSALLQHERIAFVSYPYEWSPSMLRDAGLLQLDLLLDALRDGLRLKDGTPFNVAFRGCRPVFIDVGSIERQPEGQPWPGYGQFCQTILNPLLLAAYRGLPFPGLLRAAPEGISPAETYSALGFRGLFRKGVLHHVWLHARLSEQTQSDDRRMADAISKAGFRTEFVVRTAASLRSALSAIRMPVSRSHWTTYTRHNTYSEQDAGQKRNFVAAAAASRRWRLAWDLGCNAGQFSRLVSLHADNVVAFDADVATIDSLYNSLRKEGPANVLPLCVNVANPSPRQGWLLNERLDLPSRGRPDLTLCLALLHHLVIGNNLPMEQVVDWLASLGPHLVIEFVGKADPMVQALLRNRIDEFADYSESAFEKLLSNRYAILSQEQLAGGTRRLYFAQRKA